MDNERTPEQIIDVARGMGWVPKEEFKGAEDKWISAEEFIDRGEHLLPILHATNKRLKGDVETLKSQTAELTQALRDARESMAALETYHDEDVKRKVEQARTNLKAELAEASREGDHVAVADLTSKITELNAEAKANETRQAEEEAKRKAQANRGVDPSKDPAFLAWKQDNPWYGTDTVRTALAHTMAIKLRDPSYAEAVPTSLIGRAYFDKVGEAVEKEILKLTGGKPRQESKVEGGGPRGGGGNGSGKGYRDLPPEAKAACDSFARDLVGPNKPYKTQADWQKKYAADHFSEV